MNTQPSRKSMLTGLASAAAVGLTPGVSEAETVPRTAGPPADDDQDGPRIGILLYDGFSLLDPTGPAELLCRLPGATVTMIGKRRGVVRTDTGQAGLYADRSIREVRRLDVLMVPGGGERGVTDVMGDQELLDWISQTDRHTAWTTSVCTGSLILGAAGLLRGKATTHWASASYLEETFGVRYVPERYVVDDKIVTAAGVSAGIDMALYLASRLVDAATAKAVQLGVEYDPQPPFDAGDAADASRELKERARRLIADSQR